MENPQDHTEVLLYQYRYLKEQRDMFQQQLEIINASLNNLMNTKATIENLKNVKEGEEIFLVEGKIELTVGDQTKEVEAPIKIDIPPNVFHKIKALTDIRILYFYK